MHLLSAILLIIHEICLSAVYTPVNSADNREFTVLPILKLGSPSPPSYLAPDPPVLPAPAFGCFRLYWWYRLAHGFHYAAGVRVNYCVLLTEKLYSKVKNDQTVEVANLFVYAKCEVCLLDETGTQFDCRLGSVCLYANRSSCLFISASFRPIDKTYKSGSDFHTIGLSRAQGNILEVTVKYMHK